MMRSKRSTLSSVISITLLFSLFCLIILFVFICFLFPKSAGFVFSFSTMHPLPNPVVINPTFDSNIYPQIRPSVYQYPTYSPLLSLLKHWNPDNPTPPENFSESLQHFNFSNSTERAFAEVYRKAEVPFKVYDVPIFNKVSRKWTKNYLSTNFKNMKYYVEESRTNHFMYWTTSRKRVDESYRPPTRLVSRDFTFDSWCEKAEKADILKLDNKSAHYYFMTGSQRSDDESNFVYRDLSVFRSDKPNFFIPTPEHNKGIQCRFGMRGVIAETHYDSGRNSVAMIKGNKRYILTPPETCKHLAIIADKRHPSFRHSKIDFSSLAQITANNFQNVKSVETILRRGEVLYIPSFWFHYIVSMDYSIQCNARSGFPENKNGKKVIEKCMKIKVRS